MTVRGALKWLENLGLPSTRMWVNAGGCVLESSNQPFNLLITNLIQMMRVIFARFIKIRPPPPNESAVYRRVALFTTALDVKLLTALLDETERYFADSPKRVLITHVSFYCEVIEGITLMNHTTKSKWNYSICPLEM